MKPYDKLTFGVLIAVVLTVNSFLAILHLSEWFGIQVLEQTEDYPFGGEGLPNYYETPESYANMALVWGVLFLGAFVYGIWVLKGQELAKVARALGITVLLVFALFLYGAMS